MSHFLSVLEAINNGRWEDRGKFINDPPSDHKCIPECHEIGGEPETAEMYD